MKITINSNSIAQDLICFFIVLTVNCQCEIISIQFIIHSLHNYILPGTTNDTTNVMLFSYFLISSRSFAP